jgi:hypothetical protein
MNRRLQRELGKPLAESYMRRWVLTSFVLRAFGLSKQEVEAEQLEEEFEEKLLEWRKLNAKFVEGVLVLLNGIRGLVGLAGLSVLVFVKAVFRRGKGVELSSGSHVRA